MHTEIVYYSALGHRRVETTRVGLVFWVLERAERAALVTADEDGDVLSPEDAAALETLDPRDILDSAYDLALAMGRAA